MIKIMIADDHELIRLGIKSMLDMQKDMTVIAEAKNGDELLSTIESENCDVILLDISMPGRDGIEILKQIKVKKPSIAVIIISIHLEEHYAIRALKAGASGYLNKRLESGEIIKAIRKVYIGKKYITETLAEKLSDDVIENRESSLHDMLSDREYEILLLIARGMSLIDIGNKLNISPKTVTTYRSRILQKTGLDSNADITRYALEHSLLDE